MTEQRIKDYLMKHRYVNAYQWGEENERTVRKAISNLGKDGIIFIPIKTLMPHDYGDVRVLPTKMVERFVWTLIKHLRTLYRNKVKPLQKYVKDEKLKKMFGQLDLVFEEDADAIS